MLTVGPYQLSADPVEFYGLTDAERRHVQEIRGRMATTDSGVLYAYGPDGEPRRDAAGRPVPVEWVVLPMRRFIVDSDGLVWAYRFKGAPKSRRGSPAGGVPFRHAAIEMWTGNWRRCIDPKTGRPTYAKKTMWVPIETQINLPPNTTHIEYYRKQKGFKHPLEPPDAPTDFDMQVMERKRVEIDGVVYAKAREYARRADDDLSKHAAERAVEDMEAAAGTESAREARKPTRERRKKTRKGTTV